MAKKPLRDVLAGVKSSKVVKLDHKDMYQWNSPDGLKFADDKHPVEKHEDRVGNGDDVYTGSTKPAKYPRQDAKVYEEIEELDEVSKEKVKKYKSGANKWFKDEMHKRGAYDVEASRKGGNRYKGLETASNKLDGKAKVNATEETDVNITDQKLGAGEQKTAYIEERRYLQRAAERVAGTKRRANQKLEDIARYERKRKESMERQNKEYERERDEEMRQREKEKRKREEARKKKQQRHHVKEGYKLLSFAESCKCNNTGKGITCEVHGDDECPGDKKSRKLLMDKKVDETIEIGKALRIGNQYTDSQLMRNRKDSRSLGKPANLLDRANKTIGKLKGSTFMVKKMTEEEQIDEVAPPDPKIEKWIKANKERFVKEYGAKKGKEVLYAKAWKMHGQSESGSSSPATNTDYVGPGAAGWSTGRLDTGTL